MGGHFNETSVPRLAPLRVPQYLVNGQQDGIVPAATRPAQSPSRSGTQSRTPPTCERTDGQACGEWADDVASPATAPVPRPDTRATLPPAEPDAGSTMPRR